MNNICMSYFKYLKDKHNIEELHHHIIFSWWGITSLLSKWIPVIKIVDPLKLFNDQVDPP